MAPLAMAALCRCERAQRGLLIGDSARVRAVARIRVMIRIRVKIRIRVRVRLELGVGMGLYEG